MLYRWSNCVEGFNMPVKIYDKEGKLIFIHPTSKYQQAPENVLDIKVDENFYILTRKASAGQ